MTDIFKYSFCLRDEKTYHKGQLTEESAHWQCKKLRIVLVTAGIGHNEIPLYAKL